MGLGGSARRPGLQSYLQASQSQTPPRSAFFHQAAGSDVGLVLGREGEVVGERESAAEVRVEGMGMARSLQGMERGEHGQRAEDRAMWCVLTLGV